MHYLNLKVISFVALALMSFSALASDMGSPELWFTVFVVASFLLSGTMYLLGTLVFEVLVKDAEKYKRLAVIVPSVVMVLTLLLAFNFMLKMPILIAAYLVGWGVSYWLHQFAVKFWRERVVNK